MAIEPSELKHYDKLIVIEGIDGSGKTTIAKGLTDYLISRGDDVVYLRDPGSSPLGEDIRNYVKSKDSLGKMTQQILFSASRAIMYNECILNAMKEYKWIILDRYFISTMVYQDIGIRNPLFGALVFNPEFTVIPEYTFHLTTTIDKLSILKQRAYRNDGDVYDNVDDLTYFTWYQRYHDALGKLEYVKYLKNVCSIDVVKNDADTVLLEMCNYLERTDNASCRK